MIASGFSSNRECKTPLAYWYSAVATNTPATFVPVVVTALVFQYLASTEKLPVAIATEGMPCWEAALALVRSIPVRDVAKAVGTVGTKSITILFAAKVVAVFLAFVTSVVSGVVVEKRTLKVPAPPAEMQVVAVGFTKKVALWRLSTMGPAAVSALACVNDKAGNAVRVSVDVAAPSTVEEKPIAQVDATVVPLTDSWANALPVASVRAATATRALDRFFNCFFMVISFKVKKGNF